MSDFNRRAVNCFVRFCTRPSAILSASGTLHLRSGQRSRWRSFTGVVLKVWQSFLVVFALSTGVPSSRAAGTTARVEVPILQRQLSDGTIRYSVPVRIDGGPDVDAMLDTGSFGLRVMQQVLSARPYHPLPVARPYHFGSGVVFEGMLAKARVAVGARRDERAGGLPNRAIGSLRRAQARLSGRKARSGGLPDWRRGPSG